MEQRSQEWFDYKAGKFSGSRFNALMAKTKSGPSASRKNLLTDMAVERITKEYIQTYCSPAMLRGIEMEPAARAAYEDHEMIVLREVGFIDHPTHDFIGVSPDGIRPDGGMAEFKFRSASAQHLDSYLKAAHAVKHKWQLQGQLWVAESEWVDAVSYDPRFPKGARLAIVRVERNEEMIEELEAECIKANDEVNAIVAQLEEKMKETL